MDSPIAQIEAWIRGHLADRLGLEPEEIDPARPFADYGLASLEGVNLIKELAALLGRELPLTLAWEQPTASALAAHLAAGAPLPEPCAEPAPQPAAQGAVAIIGMGARFPGAPGLAAFWELLSAGGDAITEVPPERWPLDAFYDPDPTQPGKLASRWGGFVAGVDQFDAEFFGLPDHEAAHLDPRQRLICETAWEALEDAGIPPLSLAGSRTGVFVSTLSANYGSIIFNYYPETVQAATGTGNGDSVIANRLSYLLDLRGPSMAVNTACSGALVALHLACQSLRAGESDLALAGGVNLLLKPDDTIFFTKTGALSPDGRCKVFDRSANGIVRSDGAGVVVLKPLERALADGDPIYAVVRATAVNQDGASNGLMAPNPQAQEALLREAYRRAGIDPAAVQLIEAHGTGTAVGDPIEVSALGAVLGAGREPGRRCALGSVKTNIGHTEAAAGIAGVIKTALALRHRRIPANLHFREANPLIPFERLPFYVPQALGPWPDEGRELVAGVSGFGFSGTNAHAVLSEPPRRADAAPDDQLPPPPRAELLPISARSPAALRAQAAAFAATLRAGAAPLADICRTAALRRSHLPQRLAVAGDDPAALAAALERFAVDGAAAGAVRPGSPLGSAPPMAWLFSGQGTHWAGMGRGLLDEPAFRAALERCDAALLPLAGWSLLDELAGAGEERLNQTEVAQPAIVAVQIGLAALLQSWGLAPAAVAGQSLGEIAAACVAGTLSPEDAMLVVYHRARLMRRVAGAGKTAVLGQGRADAERTIARWPGLSVAGASSPASSVIAGEPAAIDELIADCAAAGLFCRAVPGTDIAFHTPQMDPLLPELEAALAGLDPQPPAIRWLSSVTAAAIEEPPGPDYWARNLRQPFAMDAVIGRLLDEGIATFIEISPHPVLLGPLAEAAEPAGRPVAAFAALRRGQPERRSLLETAGELFARGCELDWRRLAPATQRAPGHADLPTYPWQRRRHWYDQLLRPGAPPWHELKSGRALGSTPAGHPLLGWHSALSEPAGQHIWRSELDQSSLPWLADHRVQGSVLLPAAALLEMALAAGRQLGAAAPQLSEVALSQALVLGAAPRLVELTLAPQGAGAWRWSIASQPAADGNPAAPASRWLTHASGWLEPAPASEPPPADLAALRERCPEPRTAAAHYEALTRAGLGYGPAFRGVAAVWRGEGEALARLRLAEAAAQDRRYHLHPALLDAALQAVAAIAGDETPRAMVPVGVGRYELRGAPAWVHARLRPGPAGVFQTADLLLLDEAGAVAGMVEGLRLRDLGRAAADRLDWLYEVRWRPAPLPANAPEAPSGAWLVLGDAAPARRLAARLRAGGCRVIEGRSAAGSAIPPAGSAEIIALEPADPAGSAEIIALEPANPADSAEIIALEPADPAGLAAALRGLPPLAGIVHAWGLDAAPSPSPAELERDQERCCLSLLALAQALVETRRSAPVWLATAGAWRVDEDDATEISPIRAAAWSMARVLAGEHPALFGGGVDLAGDSAGVDAADELARELAAGPAGEQIALRPGRRLAARLSSAPPHGPPPWSQPGAAPAFRPDASYLITGGLTGLGLAVAGWMLERGARRLILLGRTALPPRSRWGAADTLAQPALAERIAAVRALEARGASVHLAAADAADADQLGAFLAGYAAEGWPPIRGVIHAAGVTADRLMLHMTAAEFAAAARPKILGAWNLHRLLGDQPLDWFVLFSSASALLGTPGQANYAAGNGFLDGLAALRRAGGLPGLSINWGVWDEIGIAARAEQVERLRAGGLAPIEPARGLEALGLLLGRDAAQVACMPADWQTWRRANPEGARLPFFAELLAARQEDAPPEEQPASLALRLLDLPEPERRELALAEVRLLAARALRLDPAELDPEAPLVSLGLDSMRAIELAGQLRGALGASPSVPDLLQGASVASAAGTLLAALAPAELDQLAADLTALDPAELAALLDELPAADH